MKRKQALQTLGTASTAALLFGSGITRALASPSWTPTRHVNLIVPTPASGALDLGARLIQNLWQKNNLLPTSSTVLNKPGGGHSLALYFLSQQRGDPYYLEIDSPALLTGKLVGRTTLTYSDFTPLATMFTEYIAFAVRADSPLKTGREFIERLKTHPESLSVAIASARGGSHDIALGLVLMDAHIDPKRVKTVVFNTSGEASLQLLGGHVDVIVASISPLVSMLKAGRFRLLAVTSPHRLTGELASVPTWNEQGFDATFANWRLIQGPGGLTAAQTQYWANLIERITKLEAFQTELARLSLTLDYMAGPALTDFLKSDAARFHDTLAYLGELKS